MIANFGLVLRPVVGLLLLLSGIFLWKRSPTAAHVLITLGAVVFLGAELYGLAVLRPFVGRSFDDDWQAQISTVDAAATVGLLVSAIGLFLHARKS